MVGRSNQSGKITQSWNDYVSETLPCYVIICYLIYLFNNYIFVGKNVSLKF